MPTAVIEKIKNVISTKAEITPELLAEIGEGLNSVSCDADMLSTWAALQKSLKLTVAVFKEFPEFHARFVAAAKRSFHPPRK